jgi:homoserine kinase
MKDTNAVTAYAPGSIGNVGAGLDILGLAVAGAGDRVTIEWVGDGRIVVADAGHPELPTDPARNTAAIAANAVFELMGETPGISIRIQKGLPISGGLGGSAASAVAGAVAADRLLGSELDDMALLECALVAEQLVSGRHADNLAPSLLGGLVLIRSLDPPDVIALAVPDALHIVLAHPDSQLRTVEARAVLPASVSREIAMTQAANVGGLVAAACLDDVALFGRSIVDLIAEPVRAALLPGFVAARDAALAAGALGCSISGAGPTSFAIVEDPGLLITVADAMQEAYGAAGVSARTWITRSDPEGARIE